MTFDEQIKVKIIIAMIETHQLILKSESFITLRSEAQDGLLEKVKNDLKSLMKNQEFDEED